MISKVLNELKTLTLEELHKEIYITKNQLFELRFKKATRQSFQSHSFGKLKYKIRILLMLRKSKISKTDKNT
jgi:ribosomal protein L29